MTFQIRSILVVAVLAAAALTGCDLSQDMMMDVMTPKDDEPDTTPPIDIMPPMDTDMVELETLPVKVVWLVDYPVGGKEAYLAWIAEVAPTLLAPEELNRVASYDNVRGENPHRLVEFEFDNLSDAATYLRRPDVAAVFRDLPNRSSQVSTHVFAQRSSEYTKDENPTRTVKLVYLVDYPLGGKEAYLDWIATVAPSLQEPEEVKRIASYDNIHGATPHRYVEFEFDSIADANRYMETEAALAVSIELPNRTSRSSQLLYAQRLDYTEE